MKLFEKIFYMLAGGGIIMTCFGLIVLLFFPLIGKWITLTFVTIGLIGAAGLLVCLFREMFD